MDDVEIRLECLRIAVEFGSQRDMESPEHLVEKYYQVVMQGSGASRPVDNRKDGSLKEAKKPRSVRKGVAHRNFVQM